MLLSFVGLPPLVSVLVYSYVHLQFYSAASLDLDINALTGPIPSEIGVTKNLGECFGPLLA